MENFEELLDQELDKLPYTKHLDDGQYNNGQLVGFEHGARWAMSVIGSALLSDLMKEHQEVISNPIRFTGVHIEKIKQVFEKYGIKYDTGF